MTHLHTQRSGPICALGEILIDFTLSGQNENGQRLFAQNPGGAPANVLAALAKLGENCAFIGKVGNDMHGRFLRDTLTEAGIDTSGLLLSDTYFTTLAFVDVKPDGERAFSFARSHGADKMLTKTELSRKQIECCGIFHVGSVSLSEEPARDTTFAGVRMAKAAGAVISYDPNYRAPLWESEELAIAWMREMVPLADLVKISDEETMMVTGFAEPDMAAEALLQTGVTVAVVTLGKKGAYVRTREGGQYVPGFAANAIDATGAGDAFWGGFLYQFRLSGKALADVSLAEAAAFADFGNGVASLCVEKSGAIPAMPTMEQVQARLLEKRIIFTNII